MVFRTIQRLPLHQLFVATLAGVLSGVYIFKPLFTRKTQDQNVDNVQKTMNFIEEGKSMETAEKS